MSFSLQHLQDIAGIFRSVFESEADAYWCFERFMLKIQRRPLAAEVNMVIVCTEAQDPELWKYDAYTSLSFGCIPCASA